MRKSLFIIFCFFSIQSFGQKEEVSMKSILVDGLTYMKKIEMEMGQEIVRMEYDLIQTTKATFRTLSEEYEYGVFAFGDFRIQDIDIKVYKWVNNQWNLIDKDQETQANALVTIKPLVTGEYKFEISAAKFTTGYHIGHYGLMIFHN
jgi:hypothetical protein